MTFKNERLVAQLNDSNKKQLIIDAVSLMFSNNSIPVTVRLAQSGDTVVQPTSAPAQPEAPVSKPATPKAKATRPSLEDTDKTIPQAPIKKDVAQENLKDEKEIERIESDQEKMVLDLFDGKYVE